MSTKEKKDRIHQLVDIIPEGYLDEVHAILKDFTKDEIITELGCTKEEYNRELDEGEAEHERGEWRTQEDVFSSLTQKLEALQHAGKVEH